MKDITGKKYKALTAKQFSHKCLIYRTHFWIFECDCGAKKIMQKSKVIGGRFVSCGCGLARKKPNIKSHKHTGTRIYRIWKNIKTRVNNKNNLGFNNYGGRGIKICDRWMKFENFLADMGYPPTNKHSIDRINNDGNYEPSNCRWATSIQQTRNQRSNVIIIYNGTLKCASEWAELFNISASVIRKKYKKGLSSEEIFKDVILKEIKSNFMEV
jgi:hypothetical protein